MGRTIDKKIKEQVMSEFCFYCGRKLNTQNRTFDHITPVDKGGRDTVDNLVCCCVICNQVKKNYTIHELLEELKRQKKYCDDEIRLAWLDYNEKIFSLARKKLSEAR